eukprot:Hpha_TRINITY_DN21242_c0_g1::TRINITY_DN21242_c0_g1_i1::g.171561::m.171561
MTPFLGVRRSQVRDHFKRYLLLDSKVRFVKGWFEDSLPGLRKNLTAPLAVLRLDGDMFFSTMNILCTMYDKIEVGGVWIVDDYGITACRSAVGQFMDHHSVSDVMHDIDGYATYFVKAADVTLDEEWCAKVQTKSYAGLQGEIVKNRRVKVRR